MAYPEISSTEWKLYVNGDSHYHFNETDYKDVIAELLKEVQIGKEAERFLEKLTKTVSYEI